MFNQMLFVTPGKRNTRTNNRSTAFSRAFSVRVRISLKRVKATWKMRVQLHAIKLRIKITAAYTGRLVENSFVITISRVWPGRGGGGTTTGSKFPYAPGKFFRWLENSAEVTESRAILINLVGRWRTGKAPPSTTNVPITDTFWCRISSAEAERHSHFSSLKYRETVRDVRHVTRT